MDITLNNLDEFSILFWTLFFFNCNNYVEMGLKTNCFQAPLENIYGKIKLKDIPISISKLYHIWVWLFAQSQ